MTKLATTLLRAVRQVARFRGLLLGAILLCVTYAFGSFLHGVRPLDGWLFFQLAKIWGWEVLLTISCASFGHLVLTRFLGLGELEGSLELALSLAIGLVGFVVGIYLGGFVRVLGPVFGVGLPLALLASGSLDGARVLRQAYHKRHERRPISALALVAVGFGVLCCGLLYLGVLSPDSINYDASWNHLVIAQDYGRAGRIVPFPGDWVKNVPHLGSIVNTWAFLVPGLDKPALRWMLAQHTEYTVFLWTLVGVLAGARYLSEKTQLRGAWAALFLFPGIFVYDGNMGVAADHFLALFAVPICIAALLFMARPRWREGVLLGIVAGAGLLTKLHAVYLLIPLTAFILVGFAQLGVAQLRGRAVAFPIREALMGAAAAAATAIALLALHFGKNAVFYRNPFYPLAQGRLPSTPTVPDAPLHMDYLFADWRRHPPVELGKRLEAAFDMVWNFSFKPHYTFIGDVPTFGSLFTLLLPALLFLGRKPRLWLGIGAGLAALFVWAYTFWVDRNLQTIMPLMAACVAALCACIWELGLAARAGLVAVLGLQLAWGADYYFSGSDRIANALALIRSGMDGRASTRFDGYQRDYVALGKSLPENAVVVLHNQHVMLGINRPVFLDCVGFQGSIDYRTFRSSGDFQRRMRELGITHVAWRPGGRRHNSGQESVIFATFAGRHLKKAKAFGGLRVARIPTKPIDDATPMRVFSWNTPNYSNGTYAVERLGTIEELPPQFQKYEQPDVPAASPENIVEQLRAVDAVLIGSEAELPPEARSILSSRFKGVTQSAGPKVYVVR